MKWHSGAAFLLALGLSLGTTLSAFAREAAPRFRTLQVRLLQPDGSPAAGVLVRLKGVDRYSLGPPDNAEQRYQDSGKLYDVKALQPWRFTSGKDGCFKVKFGRFRTYGSEKLLGNEMPGWGSYYLVAEVEGGGKVVSPKIINPDPENLGDLHNKDEWSEEVLRMNRTSHEMNLRLVPGLTVAGRVVNSEGKPLPGEEVGIYHDLHVGTHTGYGGEFFRLNTVTDSEGRFAFHGIYPNTFYFDYVPRGTWMRTKVGQGWINEAVDEIPVGRDQGPTIDLEFEIGPRTPFRYWGRVVDENDDPVPNAQITFGLSAHREVRTHGDSHHFEKAKTDADGRYEILSARRFATFGSADAPGLKSTDFSFDDSFQKSPNVGLAEPGEYNFVLHQKAAPAAQ